MRIGIDISQLAYEGTGVGNYLKNLVEELVNIDSKNEYVLFFSSMRKKFQISNFPDGSFHSGSRTNEIRRDNFQSNSNVKIKAYRFPPTLLDFLWNRMHVLPIERLIGDVDVFISSDWTQAPTKKAKKATILYDLIVYKYPKETDKKIVETQKRKLKWVKEECDLVFCISEATKRDAMEVLGIEEKKLKVIYPGI
ncbi:MAG: glycosyltransferase [Candidatus Levybacteria bacterium]|nr:glycosyltransferase [Candidatus Levybacteria bacterium]